MQTVLRYCYNHGLAKIGEKVVSKPTPAKPGAISGMSVWAKENEDELAADAKDRTPAKAPAGQNLDKWREARNEGWAKLDAEEKARYEALAAAKKGPPPGHVHE
jgi:hypothetical protein